MAVSGALGLVVERVLILPVYGQHLKQILMTTGGLIVAEQALYALWGPQIIPLPLPTSLRGSFIIGDIAIAKYRLLAMLVGLIVFGGIQLVLNRTKIGLLIRAGVENREMVEALGYRIRRLFLGVFMVGSGLAGLGGVMWALYREQVHASMGNDLTVSGFHRGDHRRPRLDRRLFHRRAAGRDGRELRRLSGAETGAGLQHPADGRDPDVAPARAVCGDKSMMILSGDPPRSRVLTLLLVVIIAALAADARWSFPAPRR